MYRMNRQRMRKVVLLVLRTPLGMVFTATIQVVVPTVPPTPTTGDTGKHTNDNASRRIQTMSWAAAMLPIPVAVAVVAPTAVVHSQT